MNECVMIGTAGVFRLIETAPMDGVALVGFVTSSEATQASLL